jgi:Holliday junction DNA helicase RuvA
MIAKLTGILDSVGEDWAIVDVHGVGYLAACSSRLLARLGRPGAAVTLYTETRIRDEVPHLYGFGSRAEQEWFRLLTLVQGVGGRVALSLLSVLDPDALALAIASGDKASLSRADGVGPKLAARIAAELKDRASALSLNMVAGRPAEGPQAAQSMATAEAVSALVNLGYGRGDAFAAVTAVAAGGPQKTLDELIRAALRQLSATAREMSP